MVRFNDIVDIVTRFFSSDNGINTKATELHLGLDKRLWVEDFSNIRHTFRHFMYLYDMYECIPYMEEFGI